MKHVTSFVVIASIAAVFVACSGSDGAIEEGHEALMMPRSPDPAPRPSGDINACQADPNDVCGYNCGGWPAPHPAGCVCGTECPPPSGACVTVGCSGAVLPYTGGTCIEYLKPPGLWCNSGVGTCDAAGACHPPTGTCDPVAPAPVACSINNADCNDGNPCTRDLCQGLWCANQPMPNGTACGGGKTCNAGACCAP